jgi:hypothetical protein
MISEPSSDKVDSKPGLGWHHYLLAALFAYSLPWLAILIEMSLTWGTQVHLAGHFGVLLPNFQTCLWMAIPAAISFLILLPFMRSRNGRWIASAWICLGWTAFFLSIQVNTK